jgi:hypothetical protein
MKLSIIIIIMECPRLLQVGNRENSWKSDGNEREGMQTKAMDLLLS